jgi:hypothetical protein
MKLSFALLLSTLAAAYAAEEPLGEPVATPEYSEANCNQKNKPLASECASPIESNYALKTAGGYYLSFGASKNVVNQVTDIGVNEEFTTEFVEESGIAAIKSVERDTYLRLKPQAAKVTQSTFLGKWSEVKIVETTAQPQLYSEIGIRGLQFDRFLRAPEDNLKVVDQVENYLSEAERFVQIPITRCTLETTTGHFFKPSAEKASTGKPIMELTPEVSEETQYQLIQHEDYVLLRNVQNKQYLQLNDMKEVESAEELETATAAQKWQLEEGTLETTFALKNIQYNNYIAVDISPEAEPSDPADEADPAGPAGPSDLEKADTEDLILAPVETPSETSMLRCEQAKPIIEES